jgi:two-component system, sensor histidine kinase RegB
VSGMVTAASLSVLRQLCNLRWIAIAGQAATVALVVGALHIPLPWWPLCAGILALAAFNLYATWHLSRRVKASDPEVAGHILVDIVVLAWLVWWSGGMSNPFASLFLMPIALAILVLPVRLMVFTALASMAGYLFSTTFGMEMPPVAGPFGGTFGLHKLGMLANFVVSAAVILLFLTRVSAAWRRSEQQVALLRERFARNEGIVALATHAASVAHELNTPLATMTLLIDELADDTDPDARADDLATLRSLLLICRDRVRALAAPATSDSTIGATQKVDLEEVIAQWQLVRPTIQLQRSGSTSSFGQVDRSVGHLLQALLNNAADASEQAGVCRVDLQLNCDASGVRGEIRDYGAGFERAELPLPPALFRTSKAAGLGIGLALSHATVERLGGELSMQATDGRGVRVEFNLPECAS